MQQPSSILTNITLFATIALIARYTMNITNTSVTEKSVPSFDARRHFGKLIDGVKAGGKFVIKEHGQPVAAIVPLALYEQWKQEREEALTSLSTLMDEASANANLSEEDAMKLALEAVAAVRAEANTKSQ